MKSLRFESICLLSPREGKARKVTFHKGLNLVMGRNHTGKSTLIKSIYTAFYAVPQGKLENWNPDTICLLKFNVDDVSYEIVQQGKHRGLFQNGKLQGAAKNASQWAKLFCQATGFNLILTDKDQNAVQADARAFFLPFYINQDGSWHAKWDTFDNLGQYLRPIKPILEYFSGVRPPAYYSLDAQKTQLKIEREELQREQRLIMQVRERLSKSISLNGPKTVPAIFLEDVKLLTAEVSSLNVDQEKLRSELVRDHELLHSIIMQIQMAQRAVETFDDDSKFLTADSDPILVCPVCHAEHNRSFMDILTYAEDARVLRQLVTRLEFDAAAMRDEIAQKELQSKAMADRYRQISSVLETRRGDLKFADVIKSMGAESAFLAFDAELKDLKEKIDATLRKAEIIDTTLKALTDAKRAKQIVAAFRTAYDQARVQLNLPVIDSKKLQLTSRPNISGSAGPRSSLAYYGALWSVTSGDHGSYLPPLVVDEPRQQGQDVFNLPKMIEYVAKKLPKGAQVIMGIESVSDQTFDASIELSEPYSLLQKAAYDDVSVEVTPRLDAMSAELLKYL